MASASDIRAGKGYIEIGLKEGISQDSKVIENRLRSLGASLTSLGSKMVGIGSALAAPLLLATQRFLSIGTEIERASERTGIAVQTMIGLKYAVEQSGASFDVFEVGIRRMQRTILEAAEGSRQAGDSFRVLGIQVDQLKGLSPDQQFESIADALNKIPDPTIKAALAMQLFGRGGTALIPLLASGSTGIQNFINHAKELGLTFTNEDAVAAVKFQQVLNDLWNQINAVAFQFGAAIANALQPFAVAATRVMTTVIDWVKTNRDLVISLIPVAAGLIGVGTAIIAVGVSLRVVAASMYGFRAAIGGVTSALNIFKAGAGIAFTLLGTLANPVILGVVASLVILAVYFQVTAKAGQTAIGYLANTFQDLKNIATESFHGIADALAAGDIKLAAQILWTSLQLLWTTGTQGLQDSWQEFKSGFMRTGYDAFYGVQKIWNVVESTLTRGWLDLANFFETIWDAVIGGFADGWDEALNKVGHAMNYVHHLASSSFDYKKADNDLDNETSNKENARRKAEMKAMQDRDDKLREQLALVDKEEKQKLDSLNDANAAKDFASDKSAQTAIKALQEKRDHLQAQLDELRKQAAKEKGSSNPYQPLYNPNKGIDLDDIKDLVHPFKSQGTFNGTPSGLLSLGAGDPMNRLIKATEETAKNTRKKGTPVNYDYAFAYT